MAIATNKMAAPEISAEGPAEETPKIISREEIQAKLKKLDMYIDRTQNLLAGYQKKLAAIREQKRKKSDELIRLPAELRVSVQAKI